MCTSANQIFLGVFLKYKINTNAAVWSLKSYHFVCFLVAVVLIAGLQCRYSQPLGLSTRLLLSRRQLDIRYNTPSLHLFCILFFRVMVLILFIVLISLRHLFNFLTQKLQPLQELPSMAEASLGDTCTNF